MAVGVTYFGAGTRPIRNLPTIKTTGDPEPEVPDTTGSTTGTSPGFSTIVLDTSGGNSGYYAYKSALEKIAADQAAAAAATERATKGAGYQADYLTGLLNQGIPANIATLISDADTQGKDYIKQQYDLLSDRLKGGYAPETNIGTGYLGALGRTGAGYDALQRYLQANQPTAFQQPTQVAPTTVGNDLAAYMAGQRVSTAPVTPTIEALNAAASGGAQNYSQLLDTLARAQQAAQESRLAEQQMARSGALSGVEQLYQGQLGGLQQQQLQALAELQSNLLSQRLTAEQQAAARNQTIQDALAALLGTGYITPQQITPTTITGAAPNNVVTTSTPTILPPPAPPKPIEQLAAKVAGIQKPGLKQSVQNFVNANPNATAAQIKKKFPSLGSNIQ